MTLLTAAILVSLIFNLAQCVLAWARERAWSAERKDLITRIQANTIDSYVGNREAAERKLDAPKQVYAPLGGDAPNKTTYFEQPSVDIAGSQQATARLMEG